MGRTSFSFLFLLLLLFCFVFSLICRIFYINKCSVPYCLHFLPSSFLPFPLRASRAPAIHLFLVNNCNRVQQAFRKNLYINNIELIDLNINAVWKKSLTPFLSIVSTGCFQGKSYFKKRTFPTLKSQTKIRPSDIVAIPHGHVNLVTVFPVKRPSIVNCCT